ncbi:MAG: flippase-like domain-containing protein [Elusimicrobia bacterium]|nr:flippase-like domain-containing protein [Elusimicrobiota bacterium]
MKENNKPENKLYIYGPVMLSLVILVWLIYPSFNALSEILTNAKGLYLFFAFIAAISSYLFMGVTLWEMLKLLNHRMPFWEIGGIALVSTCVNYFVSSGGISGFATRAHLLSKRHVPYGISVTTSVVISVLIYLALSLIILQGIILNILNTHTFDLRFFESLLGVVLILFVSFSAVMMFFHHDFRASWSRKLYHGVNRIIYYFSKKEIPEESFKKFESQLNNGIHLILAKKYELPKVMLYVCIDWISSIFILFFAFKSLGIDIGTSRLIIGFSFGMLMTIIPILPGGLGAMEAAMTAIFAQMGIAWEKALAAALLFRLFYYLAPAFVSIIIYWGLKMSEPYYSYADNKRHQGTK